MDQMGWLAWIIIGGIAGWLASMVMKTRSGLIMDVVIGIVGAIIGGALFNVLLGNNNAITGFNLGTLIVSFIGAVVLLGVLRLFTRGSSVAV